MPRDVAAVQLEHGEETCIVTVLWVYPANANDAQVTGYRIFANESFLSNETAEIDTHNNEIRISSLFSVPQCTAHIISVSAVNICGHEGPKSSRFELIRADCDRVNGYRAYTRSTVSDTDTYSYHHYIHAGSLTTTVNCVMITIIILATFLFDVHCV